MTSDSNNEPIDLGSQIDLTNVWAISVRHRRVALGEVARERLAASSAFLDQMIKENRRIYGVTTGFGPLAGQIIGEEFGEELQRNLVYHLATGVGRPFSPAQTRAIMATRIRNLAIGKSAVADRVLALLLHCLNEDILPIIPEIGTVGASGDLTPLAHVALALMGEGPVLYQGQVMPADSAFNLTSAQSITFQRKDAIALVNGTAAMTGVSALNAVSARQATFLGLRLGALYAEVMEGRAEAFDPLFGQVRAHSGQIEVHRMLGSLLTDSKRVLPSVQPPPIHTPGITKSSQIPQDPYSIRCMPQIFGAILDLCDFHDGIVQTELNAATDNPLVFEAEELVLHGGNFYGQHVAFAADALALGVVKLAIHAERCIARIVDCSQNQGLPAFLSGGPIGLNSGLMGAQVTASAIIAEMRSRATPASIQSVPTNANNQDIVSMGTIAARKTAELVDLAWHVLAIEAIAMTQAFELRQGFESASGFSTTSLSLARLVRKQVDFLSADRPLSGEVVALTTWVRNQDWSVG